MVDCTKFGFKDPDKEERARGDNPVPIINFPKPERKMKIVYQSFNQSIEEIYFWILASLREDSGLYNVKKITDIFTSSEQSAFWGQSQQRMSIQQGQVSNYLATIGKLVKELFQIVRELKILDERIDLYTESNKAITGSFNQRKMSIAAETVLKGYWVDLKDGGVKSPGSVYGLASTLGYTTLPDLFFSTPPLKKNEIDSYVNTLQFNEKVKLVLKRKLEAYTVWKEHTQKEMENRHKFTLKFLRQHYNAIQMYINWLKPYLNNVRRLSQNLERSQSEDLIGSFEGSITEIEVIFSKLTSKKHHSVIVLNIVYRTQPHMDFHQDGYQHKGPVHVGRSEITFRGYIWTQEEFDNYLRMRESETMDILGDIDASLKESVNALGDDLRNYLKAAGEKFPEDIKKEEQDKKDAQKAAAERSMRGALDPFTSIFSGFNDIFRSFVPAKQKSSDMTAWEKNADRAKAKGPMEGALWNTYKNFKKAHRMVTW